MQDFSIILSNKCIKTLTPLVVSEICPGQDVDRKSNKAAVTQTNKAATICSPLGEHTKQHDIPF